MTIGIDFGAQLFKIVQLQAVDKKGKYRWIAGGMKNHQLRWFLSREAEVKEVKKFLNSVWSEYKFKGNNINTALGEGEIYSRTLTMPPLSDYELNQALKFELEQYLPLKVEDVYYSFDRLGKVQRDKKVRQLIFVAAVPRKRVDEILSLSVDYGIIIEVLENSMGALARSVSFSKKEPVLIIDLGYTQFSLGIAKEGKLYLSRKIDLSGQSLDRLVARTLNIDEAQANELRMTYGLDKKQFEGKLAGILTMALDQLAEEAKRLIAFFEDKILAEKVKEVVVVGGGAALPGMSIYLSSQINLEIGLPTFGNFILGVPEEVKKYPYLYAQVLGSAMRNND